MDYIERAFGLIRQGGASILYVLGCFIFPRPRRLMAFIDRLSGPERRVLVGQLVVGIGLVVTLGGWLISDVSPESLEGPRLTIIVLFLLVVTTIPYFAVYRWLQRERIAFAAVVLLVVGLVDVTVLQLPILAQNFVEPIRSDFANLNNGTGQGTLAYDFVCSGLEREARIVALSHEVDKFQAEADRISLQLNSVPEGAASDDLERRWHDAFMSATHKRFAMFDVTHEMDAVFERTRARYNWFFVAGDVAQIGVGVIGFLGMFFLAKGLFYEVTTRGVRVLTGCAVVGMVVLSGLLSLGVNAVSRYPDPEAYMDGYTGERTPEAFDWDRNAIKLWRADQAAREARLKARFIAAAKACPNLNNASLW
jgi:hypothetical protein